MDNPYRFDIKEDGVWLIRPGGAVNLGPKEDAEQIMEAMVCLLEREDFGESVQ